MITTEAGVLSGVLNATLIGDPDAVVSRVVTDSRAFVGAGDCFVAIAGPRFDGARFAPRALANGASVAIVAAPPPADLVLASGQAWLQAEDGLRALQQLAAWHRSQLALPVIAITGSNGKTITKDLLGQILACRFRTFVSPQSWNSQVGVALSVLRISPQDEVAVIECGISQPAEMERLRAIVQPTHGVLTNIGDAHLENFASQQELGDEKSALFADIDRPDTVLASEPSAEQALMRRLPALRFVSVASDDQRLVAGAVGAQMTADRGLAADMAASVRMARMFGVSDKDIVRVLQRWRPAPMRLQMLSTPGGILILDDAYIADGVSLENALQRLQEEARSRSGRSIAVLGGVMLDARGDSPVQRALVGRLRATCPDILVGVGEQGESLARTLCPDGGARVVACRDAREAALVVEDMARAPDCVLLKGSSSLALDVVVDQLGARMTSARVLVNLAQIVENLDCVRRATGVGTMAVIKAFGYGLDAARIARELERAGIEHFCVAYPAEGVVLRQRGISAPILVQNVLPEEAALLLRYRLQCEIGSVRQLNALADEAGAQRDLLEVHLKVDTGMGRLGVMPADAPDLFAAAAAHTSVRVVGLMTHFASSESDDRSMTEQQIRVFDHAVSQARAAGLEPRWVHACNSSAIARFPQAHYSMVRVGIGLFGYSASGAALGQRPVLTLEARVIEVKEIPQGWPVGYGSQWVAPAAGATIAVVSVGYNDGYPRALSNRAWMSVHGVRCPVVGSVCMDVTMLDISAVPVAVRAGDVVRVFGPGASDPTVEELSSLAGTIPYELLTRLSGRVRRVHVAQD